MSEDKKLTRRALLSIGWRDERSAAPETPARGFSLDAFYRDRQRTGAAESALPAIRLREGLAFVETTNIGTPELASRSPRAIDGRQFDAAADRMPSVPGAAPLRLLRDRCLAWQRSFCTVCSERCPELGAIVLDEGRPVLVEERCTRCGECIAVCPAPINAFELAISPDEPSRPVA
jgi:ferredoxin